MDSERALMSVGTGFFATTTGHILTASSVVNGSDRIWVECDDIVYAAELAGEDNRSGVALLRLYKVDKQYPFVSLQPLTPILEVGTFLVGVSRELGLPPRPTRGMLTGHVSSAEVPELPTLHYRSDLSCNAAEPGAPVFNYNGQFVGMLVAALPEVQGSFILPAQALLRVRDDLLNEGKVRYGWIGMHIVPQSDPESGRQIMVNEIEPGSPASESGIKPGDVILKVGEYPIDTIGDLGTALFFARVDQYLPVKIRRGKDRREISVRVRERPKESVLITKWQAESSNPAELDSIQTERIEALFESGKKDDLPEVAEAKPKKAKKSFWSFFKRDTSKS